MGICVSGCVRVCVCAHVCVCACVCMPLLQMEPARFGHRAAVSDGDHSGGDRNQRCTAHQSHHNQNHEGAEDSTRYTRTDLNTHTH